MDGQPADQAQPGNPEPASGEGTNAAEGFATDLAIASPGSGPDPALPDGAQDGQPDGTGQQGAQATEPPKWSSAVSKEVRDDPRFATWAAKQDSFSAAVKNALELESKIGGMITLPTDKSSPEEIAAFYTKVGVPSKPEEYKLDRTDGLDYDDTQEQAFKDELHKKHVPQDVANWIYKEMGERTKAAIEARSARMEEDKTALRARLEKEHGKDYGAFVSTMQQGIAKYGSKELIVALKKSGLEYNLEVVNHFHRLGQLVKPDSALQRGGSTAELKSNAEIIGKALLGEK
jgi:hypothetical protein